MKAVLIVNLAGKNVISEGPGDGKIGDASATGSGFRRPGVLVGMQKLSFLVALRAVDVFGVYGCSKAGLGISLGGPPTIQKRTVVQFR